MSLNVVVPLYDLGAWGGREIGCQLWVKHLRWKWKSTKARRLKIRIEFFHKNASFLTKNIMKSRQQQVKTFKLKASSLNSAFG